MSRKTKKTTKQKNESGATKLVRTGEKDFVVHHDDGSYFECKVNDKRQLDSISSSKIKGSGNLYSVGGFGERKPLVCDKCNERVYKITVENGRSLCRRCA